MSETAIPLVVDMDGTLIRSDSLLEGCVQLWRERPLQIALLPLWLSKGRAGFKHALADRVSLDPRQLPFNHDLIEALREQRQHRSIVLCTAADRRFANAVAQHLDVFDDVIATIDGVNLKSEAKAKLLVERYGHGGFDYAGNDVADIAVFNEARRALVVNPTAALSRRVPSIANAENGPSNVRHSSLRAHWRALRPTQWAKNILVFIPLLAVGRQDQPRTRIQRSACVCRVQSRCVQRLIC